ncbi:MAG: hypothetical protein DRJ01_10490 [Bacteroidetes bacterium]|nr:MAG: hypothetical protein DRJ01_10490 [Bacteroidota bacterium]
MTIKTAIAFCLTVFIISDTVAQNADMSYNKITVSLSYYGNMLIKPGVKAGVEYVVNQKKCFKKNKRKSITDLIVKQLIVAGDIGFFWHPHSHIAVFNYYTLNYRIVKPSKRSINTIGLGPGVYRSVYPKTYEVDNMNNVKSVSWAGRTYFAPVVVLGTGKMINHYWIQSWHFNTNIMVLFNYNTGFVPLLSFDIGLNFKFNKK